MMTLLPDVNVLLAWAWSNHDHHRVARAFAAEMGEWATCPATESAFVRLSMNARVVVHPTSFIDALDLLRQLTGQPEHRFWSDDVRLCTVDLPFRVQGHRQVTDAHLVAVAASNAGRLVTFDSGISTLLRRPDRRLVQVLPTR